MLVRLHLIFLNHNFSRSTNFCYLIIYSFFCAHNVMNSSPPHYSFLASPPVVHMNLAKNELFLEI